MSARVLIVVCTAAFAFVGCKSSVDPNKGRFSCQTDADCGTGFQCRAQFEGSSLCFKTGECADVEQCNGVDDTCDGRVDESFDTQGDPCVTGQLGLCSAGVKACADAGVVCQRAFAPQVETCNAVDDDCDGMTDEDFDLTSADLNCGSCGHACGSGTNCRASSCAETNCMDGIDNDGDGGIDCADPACAGLSCGLALNCGRAIDDGGSADAGEVDGGDVDGGDFDGGFPDAGDVDGGGPADSGFSDAGMPDAGLPTIAACVPHEISCDNALDDDLDGKIDCADTDCEALPCAVGMVCHLGRCQ